MKSDLLDLLDQFFFRVPIKHWRDGVHIFLFTERRAVSFLGYGLESSRFRVRLPDRVKNFCLRQRVQNGGRSYAASCQIDTNVDFLGMKPLGHERCSVLFYSHIISEIDREVKYRVFPYYLKVK
jgi:hypothetical protein